MLLRGGTKGLLDAPIKYPGWIGPFHSSSGAVWGGENVANGSTLWEAFHFGTSCIENSAEDEGFELKQVGTPVSAAVPASSFWLLLQWTHIEAGCPAD